MKGFPNLDHHNWPLRSMRKQSSFLFIVVSVELQTVPQGGSTDSVSVTRLKTSHTCHIFPTFSTQMTVAVNHRKAHTIFSLKALKIKSFIWNFIP